MIVFAGGCLERIAHAVERAYPEECCGLLIGRRDTARKLYITEVAESDNVAIGQRNRRFELDPALRLSLMRRLRGTADDIVGHYHSHPDGTAVPSAHDAAMVFEPELVWLIISVSARRAGDARCWQWDQTTGSFLHLPHRPNLRTGST